MRDLAVFLLHLVATVARLAGPGGVRSVGTLDDLAGALPQPRAMWLMVPAGECFGLIFIDAPFTADSTAEVLALIAHLGLLAPDGFAVTRQFHRAPAPVADELECVNVAKLGDHRIALYRRLHSEAPG